MERQNDSLSKGEYKALTFTVLGDYSAYKWYYYAGSTLSPTSYLIYKRNLVAGGADTQITATYSSTTGYTTITVYIAIADTISMTIGTYYQELWRENADDSTNKVPTHQGELAVKETVYTSAGTFTPIYGMTIEKFIAVKVVYPSTVTILQQGGWTTDLTATFADGALTIASADSELALDVVPLVNQAYTETTHTTAQMVITPTNASFGTLTVVLYKFEDLS